MALGAAGFDELVTSTMERIDESQLYDNVFTRKPSLDLLKSEEKSGTGRSLVMNLELGENTSTQWSATGSGEFDTAKTGEILSAAEYDWSSPLTSAVRLVYKTLKMNQGKQQIVALLDSHLNNMEKSHANKLVSTLHALADNAGGTSDIEAGSFLSLDQIVSDEPYDSDPHGDATNNDAFDVGKIDSAAQPLWQASRIELPVDGSYDIRRALRHVSNEVYVNTKGNHRPDVLLAGRDIFEEFEDSFDGSVRYTEFGEGQTRFSEIKHGELTVRLDPDCPSRRAYFLTTEVLDIRSLAGTFMERQESQKIQGTLDRVHPVATMMAIGTAERRAAAVLLRPTTAGAFA